MNPRTIDIKSPSHLEEVISSSIEKKAVSYFLFCSPWDPVSSDLMSKLLNSESEDQTVHIIDTFEIPQAVSVFKSTINKLKPTMNLNSLRYHKIPQMVVMHKAFPRIVDYNGAIYAELGL